MCVLQAFVIIFTIIVILFELNFLILKHKGVTSSVVFVVLAIVTFCLYSYFDTPDFIREIKGYLLVLNHFIFALIPALTIFWFSWKVRQRNHNEIHFTAIALALVNTIIFPAVALFTSCYTGLDCI